MLFNSLEFLVFGILFFALWPVFNRENNLRWGFITTMSFIFYGWWDWRFLFLIVASGVIDYTCGWYIPKSKSKKLLLIASLVANLGLLTVFKYSLFFATMLDTGFGYLGLTTHLADNIPGFTLILPVGISFYTFQSLSYTIDIYRGRLKPVSNPLHFFSYLSMFPQLVAGPIIRAKDLLQQLAVKRKVSHLQKWNGIKLIVFGLFQKMVIADNLAFFIDSAFQHKTIYDGTLFWWLAAVAFAFQIYCDFCGYSLIARGLAKYMGYHFKMNFNHPYVATSLRNFWNRWHISLSTWFRDYVYIPLGGSRKGMELGIVYLWITMLLSGLWHGANYTFLMWAAIHAFFLSIERLTGWTKLLRFPVGTSMAALLVFAQVCVAWVYFRAESVDDGHHIVWAMVHYVPPTSLEFLAEFYNSLIILGVAIVIEACIHLRHRIPELQLIYRRSHFDLILVPLTLVALIFFRGEGQQFIYFQF